MSTKDPTASVFASPTTILPWQLAWLWLTVKRKRRGGDRKNDSGTLTAHTLLTEPGYYEDGKFGIRIENVLVVRDANTPNNFGDRGYLGFEHVTLVPLGRKLIDVELLSPDEKKWVNEYHAETLEKLTPLLASDADALEWLKKETVPI